MRITKSANANCNISFIVVTLETSHVLRCWLNEDASLNILCMAVTMLETSHALKDCIRGGQNPEIKLF
eukprot:scaffold27542_cov33-Attheya_sp.AAC.1